VVPVRVTRQDAIYLRRLAREIDGNVSEVIRRFIAERRRHEQHEHSDAEVAA
jgi:hypothetical protein